MGGVAGRLLNGMKPTVKYPVGALVSKFAAKKTCAHFRNARRGWLDAIAFMPQAILSNCRGRDASMCRIVRGLFLVGIFLDLASCSGSSSTNGAGGSTSSAGAPADSGGSSHVAGGTPPTGGASTNAGSGGMTSAVGGSRADGGVSASTPATGGAAAGASSSTQTSAPPGTGGASSTTLGTGGASSTTRAAGGTVATGGSTTSGGVGTGGSATSRVSVLQHHNHSTRDGVYVDAALTKAAAASLHVDTTFASAMLSGPTYAQPLYLASSGSGPDLAIAVTEQNRVYAFNAATGAQVYNVLLGTPLPRAQLASLKSGCGNIDPLGITGTPVIDAATRTIYLDAMTSVDATAANARHLVFALNADTGATLSGWPVNLSAAATSAGTPFDSLVQNQRGALMLLEGQVFVPFGGHIGDCSDYHGWIVGISTTNPTQVTAWATRAIAGGVWAPGGISSDGTSIFFATGNTEADANNFSAPGTWQDGEAIFRLSPSLARATATTDYFVPSNWAALDAADSDIGGTNPIVFDVTAATPSGLVIGLGKDGKAYVLDRANLGGISNPLAGATVSTGAIINAAAEYSTPSGAFVVFKGSGSGCPSGQSGGLTAIKIGASSPPTVSVAWCGGPSTQASPAVSLSNAQGQDAIVWIVGSDNKLHGLDGVTGASVFGGGATTDTMSAVQKFETPIVANGRIFVAANSQVYAFSP